MYLLVGYFPAGTCSLSHVCSQHCQDFICHVLTVDVFKVLCPQRQESNSVLLFESPDEQMWAERKKCRKNKDKTSADREETEVQYLVHSLIITKTITCIDMMTLDFIRSYE